MIRSQLSNNPFMAYLVPYSNSNELTTWSMTTLQRLAAWDSNFGNLGYNYPVNQTFFSGSLSTIPGAGLVYCPNCDVNSGLFYSSKSVIPQVWNLTGSIEHPFGPVKTGIWAVEEREQFREKLLEVYE